MLSINYYNVRKYVMRVVGNTQNRIGNNKKWLLVYRH